MESFRLLEGSPAPAGIDPVLEMDMAELERFPRTRGDRPPPIDALSDYIQVPPHPRG